MVCPGIVTNVTNFGAFVDIGVHQDGLVHISQLADRFVKDPREVVSPGDRVSVRVLEVKLDKNQIALTMKSERGQERRPVLSAMTFASAPRGPTAAPASPPAPRGPRAQGRAAGEDSVQQRLCGAREAAAPVTRIVRERTMRAAGGYAAGAGGWALRPPPTPAPVTRGAVPTLGRCVVVARAGRV